jgi:hypothetical protein
MFLQKFRSKTLPDFSAIDRMIFLANSKQLLTDSLRKTGNWILGSRLSTIYYLRLKAPVPQMTQTSPCGQLFRTFFSGFLLIGQQGIRYRFNKSKGTFFLT